MPLLLVLAIACAGPGPDSAPVDTRGTAPLAALSSGECPDFGASGSSTFTSSGEARQVTVILPADPAPDMALVVYFHGTAFPSETSSPGADTALAEDVQALADATNTVWLLPDSRVQELLGTVSVYLWDVEQYDDHDLVLFDDLRTCAATALDVDLARLSVIGFSGGALWNTVLLGQRADTLAAAVELSGGSDVVIEGLDAPFSTYSTPAVDVPVLVTTGADGEDVWPTTAMVMVDFNVATDTLESELLADGHFLVRCQDGEGHEQGARDWSFGTGWATGHRFGEPSPWQDGDLGENADWCWVGGQEPDSSAGAR